MPYIHYRNQHQERFDQNIFLKILKSFQYQTVLLKIFVFLSMVFPLNLKAIMTHDLFFFEICSLP